MGVVASTTFVELSRAEPCGSPNLVEAFPANGARRVPTNAILSASYAATAIYLDEDVQVTPSIDTARAPVFTPADHVLTLPNGGDAPALLPDTEYAIAWPALRGTTTAARGTGRTVRFSTGSGPDTVAPAFEGLARLDWDVQRETDECTDKLEDRFEFDVYPGTASDDTGRDSLVLLVNETLGPGLGKGDPAKPVLITALPPDGSFVRIRTSIAEGEGDVCFAALVRDLAGNRSDGADKEVCTHTTAPPFFYGCGLAVRKRDFPSPPLTCTAAILAGALLARRRSRRFRRTASR